MVLVMRHQKRDAELAVCKTSLLIEHSKVCPRVGVAVGEEEEGVGVDVEEEEVIGRLHSCLMQQTWNFVLDMRSVREIVLLMRTKFWMCDSIFSW